MECEKNRKRVDRSDWLVSKPISQVLLQLTGPMLPAIVAVMALDLFDAYLISKISTEHLAALSFTIPITTILFALSIGFSIGTVSVLSFRLGKGEHHKAKRLVTDGLIISCLFAVVISLFGWFSIEFLFENLGVNYALIPESFHLGPRPNIMPLIDEYMRLRYIGFIFMLISILSNSIMRATGDTLFAGRLMLAWALITALLDGLLVFYPITSSGLISLAQGHLIADFIFAFASIFILYKRENILEFRIPCWYQFVDNCKAIFKIAMPASGVSMLTPIAMAIVTSWVAFYGRESVAAFGVLTRIESLALFVPMVLSTSLPVFVGQNFGAGFISRALSAIKSSLVITVAAQLFIFLSLVIFADPIGQFFSNSKTVSDMISFLLYFVPIGFVGRGISILVGSSLNAIHRAESAFILTLIQMFFLYVPSAYLGAYWYGLNGLFVGLVLANIIIAFLAYFWMIESFKPFQLRSFRQKIYQG